MAAIQNRLPARTGQHCRTEPIHTQASPETSSSPLDRWVLPAVPQHAAPARLPMRAVIRVSTRRAGAADSKGVKRYDDSLHFNAQTSDSAVRNSRVDQHAIASLETRSAEEQDAELVNADQPREAAIEPEIRAAHRRRSPTRTKPAWRAMAETRELAQLTAAGERGRHPERDV